ncbi:MAG TPA: DUF4870 domain-containing protein [Streptosporangiaceae bacterium]|nr:DUF4870 domain-containing protein [Streptosporangiaceae bacterium]
MSSHSTGPFDPIAQAPDPDDSDPKPKLPRRPVSRPPNGPQNGAFTGPPSGSLRDAFTGPPSGPITGPPSGPIAGPFTGPPSGPLAAPPAGTYTGPVSGPIPVDHRFRTGAEPPDHHHEAVHPDVAAAAAAHHEPGRGAAGYRAAAPMPTNGPGLMYGQAGDDDQLWAMMAYLGMIFFAFLPPLAVYLLKRHESRYVRWHAAQALNLWITAFLYTLSFMIIGGILALDTIATALSVGIPLIAATGIVMLFYAVRAAVAAGRGGLYQMPSWISVPMVK